MKKPWPKRQLKLTLSRETLHILSEPNLLYVHGGVLTPLCNTRTVCGAPCVC
jgi:hypothetical protein